MTEKVEVESSASPDKIERVECLKCARKTKHSVLVEVRESGSINDHDVQWVTDYQVVQCRGCDTLSFRKAETTSEDYVQVGFDEWDYLVTETLYPQRLGGRAPMAQDEQLPRDLLVIYTETLAALNANLPVLCAIGVRAVLERVCKDQQTSNGNLERRIDQLVELNLLTKPQSLILHEVRGIGNNAAHEAKPASEAQLAVALDVVEHLLTGTYVLPGAAAKAFPARAVGDS